MNIFVTKKFPKIGIDLLKQKGYSIRFNHKNQLLSEDSLIKALKDIDGVLCTLTEKFTERVIDSCNNLKVISNYAVGYNNIDIPFATKKGIAVTNTPGVLTDATADIAMTLILNTSRRIIESDRFMRYGKFAGWEPNLMLGIGIQNKILGIIGAGRIGQAVAKRARAFGMEIIYTDAKRNKYIEMEQNAKRVSLNLLLTKSDVVSIHVPLTADTFHMLGKEKLSLLKRDSILINTARGEVIDEKFLISLLKKKKIFAAGFDVYEGEPKVNKELLKLNNVVLLPHIGSATHETRNEMSRIAAQNMIDVLSGHKPKFILNPEIFVK